MKTIKIKRAVVSVYDKTNLNLLADYFIKNDIQVLSTGGTSNFLKKYSKSINLIEIADFTKFNEILGGRVKSLHPYIHSGILAKKSDFNHKKELEKINVPFVDLVVVNLYPFEKVINETESTKEKCIENIDIGGPTLIRSAAKNYENVTILSEPSQYELFLKETKKNNSTSKTFREDCAKLAFENTAFYEAVISNWFNKDESHYCKEKITIPLKKISRLRYGENPHQKAALFRLGTNNFQKISGKELSYNNINDLEIATELAEQFSKASCVILKHGNPCGVALDTIQAKAYNKALQCDKESAFGGIVAFNRKLSIDTAKEINNLFTEVVIAPGFSFESKKLLSQKKNLILVEYISSKNKTKLHFKSSRNFLLLQNKDNKIITRKNIIVKTRKKPKEKVIEDMIFAFVVSKYVNSNAIVLVEDLATKGIGVGQTSRFDSAQQAIKKMKSNFKKFNPVLASDGFFPFPDIVKLCSKHNISGIIQPGGSKNDESVIEESNKKGIPHVFTGIRHFKH